MERLKFTVIRSKWLNGSKLGPGEKGKLLNDAGLMCCLGFYCRQLVGSTEADIVGVALPDTNVVDLTRASDTQKEALRRLLFADDVANMDNEVVNLLAQTNDDVRPEEPEREALLKEYFDEIGVDVEFVD